MRFCANMAWSFTGTLARWRGAVDAATGPFDLILRPMAVQIPRILASLVPCASCSPVPVTLIPLVYATKPERMVDPSGFPFQAWQSPCLPPGHPVGVDPF